MTLCLVCHGWQRDPLCEDCITVFAQPVARCRRCALALGGLAQGSHAFVLSAGRATASAFGAATQGDGAAMRGADTTGLCDDCRHTPPPLARCIAAVDYAYPWSDLIAQFKFGGDAALARSLAALMRHTPWAEPALDAADRVLPLPLSPQRLRERGFNQALELARPLAPDKLDLDSLRRLEDAPHQVGASRAERQQQVAHSFWLAPATLHGLRGQRIVLVDDVMTTGATLHAAAHLLRRAGAAEVTALVFARTPRPA